MIYDLAKYDDLQKATLNFTKLKESQAVIELKAKSKKRTIKQNSYLHVIITLYAIEYGYTIEEAKTLIKRECWFMRYTKNSNVFLKRTRDLNTVELTEFIDWLRNWSAKQGCYLPTPEEYLKNQIEIDKTIAFNQNYL